MRKPAAFFVGIARLAPLLALLSPLLAESTTCQPGTAVVAGPQGTGPRVFPVQWQWTETPQAPVRAGQEFRAVLQATVAAGWHLYALDEPEEGPPPLEFSAVAGGPVTLVSVGEDRPERGVTGGAASPVNFHGGQPRFRLRLRASPALTAGAEVAIAVRFQACNERLCLPPHTATLRFPLIEKH